MDSSILTQLYVNTTDCAELGRILDLGLPPEDNGSIDLRYSADPLKVVSSLRLVPYPWAILKIWQPSSLVYRPRHGLLP